MNDATISKYRSNREKNGELSGLQPTVHDILCNEDETQVGIVRFINSRSTYHEFIPVNKNLFIKIIAS